ncbi:MAG: IS1 family transposase [Lachnospira sp.]|nr:IS1 family transposase [Lachnospira sp.]
MANRKLSNEDKEKLDSMIEAKKQAIKSADYNICPTCSSQNIKKNGCTHNNQRMYCNDCHTAFTSYPKENLYRTVDFLSYVREDTPIYEISQKLDVPERTLYRKRAELIESIKNNESQHLNRMISYYNALHALNTNKKTSKEPPNETPT